MVSMPCIIRLMSEVSGFNPNELVSTSICSTASKHSGGWKGSLSKPLTSSIESYSLS